MNDTRADTKLLWEITPRQATLGVIAITIIGSWLSTIANTATGGGAPVVFVGGSIMFTVLGLVYWRTNWRWAPAVIVTAFTLLMALGLPEPFVSQKLSLAVLMPSLLALMLLNEWWVIGTGLVVAAGIAIRAGGTGPFVGEPVTLLIYIIAIAIMVVIRLLTSTALAVAERNARHAEAARALAEDRARELEHANVLMETQLDQQKQLLDLVATLETPAVTLADGVLLATIVGHVDSRRAHAITARLLDDAHAGRARLVILDIAGVALVDTSVAQAILGTARALKLLGCAVALSGISAQVAVTMTHLGMRLDEITSVRSPQEALDKVLKDAPSGWQHSSLVR